MLTLLKERGVNARDNEAIISTFENGYYIVKLLLKDDKVDEHGSLVPSVDPSIAIHMASENQHEIVKLLSSSELYIKKLRSRYNNIILFIKLYYFFSIIKCLFLVLLSRSIKSGHIR